MTFTKAPRLNLSWQLIVVVAFEGESSEEWLNHDAVKAFWVGLRVLFQGQTLSFVFPLPHVYVPFHFPPWAQVAKDLHSELRRTGNMLSPFQNSRTRILLINLYDLSIIQSQNSIVGTKKSECQAINGNLDQTQLSGSIGSEQSPNGHPLNAQLEQVVVI